MIHESGSDIARSARTTVRREAMRAEYRSRELQDILRAGAVAHVGVNTDDGPLVLPMIYGIVDDTMYLHGALANSLLKAGADSEVCATVTIVDGLVIAKTPFNHSMNYRSVVIRGRARIVDDANEILVALRAMTDHVVPTWDRTRPSSPGEIRATRVVALPLTEMSGKVRSGEAVNEPDDHDADYWTGFIPLTTVFGEPVPNGDSRSPLPDVLADLAGKDLHAKR